MRVTYKQKPDYGIGTVGRAQVLINKDEKSWDVSMVRRKVSSVLATLGNMRYAEENRKGPKDPEILLDIAVKSIVSLANAGWEIVHIEVKILDLDFYDYEDLLER